MINVRPFRDTPTLLNKIGVALVYLVLGWVVTTYPAGDMGNLLSIFLILGILCWIFIIRHRSIKYFVRFHIVQALLLNLSIAALIWLFMALLSLLASVPGLSIIAQYIAMALLSSLNIGELFYASVKEIILGTLTLVMVFYALRGRYTELPWITDGVRHWI